MIQREEFTIALNDLLSSRLDRVSDKTDRAFSRINRSINSVDRSSKQASYSIAEIDRRLDALNKIRRLSIDTSSIKAANREISQLEAKKAEMEGLGGGRGIGMGGYAAIGAVAYGVGSFLKSSAQLTMQNEQNAVSFEVLLGSAGRADKMLRNIADFSAKTPFRKLEVTEASQALLGYGVNAERVLPVLNQLGDVSRGNSEVFKRVVENYGKAVSAQRMRTEDINQFAEAGIPMWAELEKITGKSGQALRKYVETNGISVDMMNQAFASMTGEGGKFHNMMQKQSLTTTGKISTLADNFDELKLAAGNRMKPTIDGVVNALSGMVDRATRWMTIPVTEQLGQQQAKMNMLVRSITDYNLGEDERKQKLSDLQAAYPEYFGNIDTENIKNNELLSILVDVNRQYERKINIAANQDVVNSLQQEIDKAKGIYAQLDQAKIYMDLYKTTGNEMYKTMYDKTTAGMTPKMLADITNDRARVEHEMFVSMRDANKELVYSKIVDEKAKIKDVFYDLSRDSSEAINKHFAGNTQQLIKFQAMYAAVMQDTTFRNQMLSGNVTEGTLAKLQKVSGLIGSGNSTPDDTGTGLSNSSASGLGSGVTDVSGDRVAQKNVIININHLVENFTVSSTNITEGAGQTRDIITQYLLDAVNDTNQIAQ